MTLKFIVAGLLAAASVSAAAGDQRINMIADGEAHIFDALVGDGILSGGHDLLTFTGLGPGVYNIAISITGQRLNFDGVVSNLNGVQGYTFGVGGLKFFGVEFTGAGPYLLDLAGRASAGANYAGTYTVSAVPEPASYGMLLGGLGLLGFMARRKSATKAA
ncbi:FxDxF family PEP-CTERM protein [Janthinobacterium agaricidamnosum]|uniref:Variant PEP-CTERM putative exosortase signal, Roseobacter type domain protein n=1 Tax=Janthinobacterium agaricidamnosum NBRC 102515 = DSM 9628 TaxID=1349767 RepID=W0VB38_9BURK|nr:FxDxF family PEP-CTERM protein [Janthinobacterium agaricidamnosum]CDG84573.1 variant PEP-CTERM putative exosortase signal, Roseobacter type domain protein [Janthinobacterium agaricidamnosum NBRC 102515 = DSM 9628]